MGKAFARMVAIVRSIVLANQVVFVENSSKDSIVKLVSFRCRKSSMIIHKLFYPHLLYWHPLIKDEYIFR